MAESLSCVGIDFGSLTSSIAKVGDDGQATTVADSKGRTSIPNLMHFGAAGVTVASDVIGSPSTALLEGRDSAREAGATITVGQRKLPGVVSDALLLRHLLECVSPGFMSPLQSTIAVPDRLTDGQRMELLDAAGLAGLASVTLLNRTASAAVSFAHRNRLIDREGVAAREQLLLVYYLDSTSLEAAIYKLQSGNLEAIASRSEATVGAETLVRGLAKELAERAGIEPGPSSDPKAVALARHTIRQLSGSESADIQGEIGGKELRVTVSKNEFLKLVRPLLEQCKSVFKELLRETELKWSDVRQVVPAGDADCLPLLLKLLEKEVGRQLTDPAMPEDAIAQGAALHAAAYHAKASGGSPVLQVQSTASHGLAVASSRQRKTRVLIPRDSPLPAVSTIKFATTKQGQTDIGIDIVETSDESGKNAVRIGRCILPKLEKELPARTPIEVCFKYETDGTLSTNAWLPTFNLAFSLPIDRPSTLSDDERKRWATSVQDRMVGWLNDGDAEDVESPASVQGRKTQSSTQRTRDKGAAGKARQKKRKPQQDSGAAAARQTAKQETVPTESPGATLPAEVAATAEATVIAATAQLDEPEPAPPQSSNEVLNSVVTPDAVAVEDELEAFPELDDVPVFEPGSSRPKAESEAKHKTKSKNRKTKKAQPSTEETAAAEKSDPEAPRKWDVFGWFSDTELSPTERRIRIVSGAINMVLHAVLLLALYLITIDTEQEAMPDLMTFSANEKDEEDIVEETEPLMLDEAVPEEEPEPQVDSVESLLIEDDVDTDIDVNDLEPSLPEIADAAESGPAVPVAGQFSGRSKATRSSMVAMHGGNDASEKAVGQGLSWLASHQRADGGWSFDHSHVGCNCADTGDDAGSNLGATGLVLLTYLGAGQTFSEGEYQGNVKRGLDFVVRNARLSPEGADLRGGTQGNAGMYIHGINTIALCEALAMSQSELNALASNPGKLRRADLANRRRLINGASRQVEAVAGQAVKFILNAQSQQDGSWGYRPGSKGDTSVLGWQMMALVSAQTAGIPVPQATVARARAFLDYVQAEDGAQYGYRDKTPKNSMTAVAVLCRMYMGWDRKHPGMKLSVEHLSKAGPDRNNMYYNYYATQVMHHYGGEEWKKWNDVMREQLVSSQVTTGHAAGSWNLADPHGKTGGRLYMTCLATMTLEVYYRHLPLYQETEGSLGE